MRGSLMSTVFISTWHPAGDVSLGMTLGLVFVLVFVWEESLAVKTSPNPLSSPSTWISPSSSTVLSTTSSSSPSFMSTNLVMKSSGLETSFILMKMFSGMSLGWCGWSTSFVIDSDETDSVSDVLDSFFFDSSSSLAKGSKDDRGGMYACCTFEGESFKIIKSFGSSL